MLPYFGEGSQFSTRLKLVNRAQDSRRFGGFKTLCFRTCHQHQLRGCYSCSLFCMFLYICFSRYFNTTEFTAMGCDVSAYVVLIMCNSSCFLHKVHQFQLVCYYQSVWRGGGWSRAVCSVGIFFTSFQPSQLEIWGLARSTRGTRSTRNGTCNLWWGSG